MESKAPFHALALENSPDLSSARSGNRIAVRNKWRVGMTLFRMGYRGLSILRVFCRNLSFSKD
jgi:hypothetical protein